MHGIDAHRVRVGTDGLGKYSTKAAREVAATYAKDSRTRRSPAGILRDATDAHAVDDLTPL